MFGITARFTSISAICVFLGQPVLSATYTLYHEGDPPGPTTYTTSIYTDYTSLVNNSPAASDTAAVTHGTGVSLGGLAWDGTQYVALRESDPGGLNNYNFATYDTYNDLRNNNFSSSSSMKVQWGTGVSARGLAHDGERYILLIESDPGGLNNVNLAFYDTYLDLINNNFSGTQSWGKATWGTGVSVVGLAHDGNEYLMMLESDPGGLNNYNIARFATFNDLRARNFTGTNSLGQNYISPSRSIGGLAGIAPADPGEPPDEPGAIPLPASAFGLISAFVLLGAVRRRRG